MVAVVSELEDVAIRLERLVAVGQEPSVRLPLEKLQAASETVGKAWSGSSLGYHANVYYAELEPPPSGARFSVEWGLEPYFSGGTVGEWTEFDAEYVKAAIREMAGNPDLGRAISLRDEVVADFKDIQMDVLSILESRKADPFLKRVFVSVEKVSVGNQAGILRAFLPRGQIMSRDSTALSQGLRTPPHLSVMSEVLTVSAALVGATELGRLARQAARHLRRHERPPEAGHRVFVGHGRSQSWRELKDFLQERLGLDVDEFNRVPVAGVSHTDRLSEMLDSAAMALIVMTAEDEQSDGSYHPRMNVVHEAGLFQGRLGFKRALVLLEEDCQEFSNIHGLAQLRFPRGRISAVFEDVRRVIEREGLGGGQHLT